MWLGEGTLLVEKFAWEFFVSLCPCNWGWQPLQYLSHLIPMPLKLPPSCLELVILYASYMRINALPFSFPRTINLPQTTTHKIQPKMHQWNTRHGAQPTKNNSWCLSTFHAHTRWNELCEQWTCHVLALLIFDKGSCLSSDMPLHRQFFDGLVKIQHIFWHLLSQINRFTNSYSFSFFN